MTLNKFYFRSLKLVELKLHFWSFERVNASFYLR